MIANFEIPEFHRSKRRKIDHLCEIAYFHECNAHSVQDPTFLLGEQPEFVEEEFEIPEFSKLKIQTWKKNQSCSTSFAIDHLCKYLTLFPVQSFLKDTFILSDSPYIESTQLHRDCKMFFVKKAHSFVELLRCCRRHYMEKKNQIEYQPLGIKATMEDGLIALMRGISNLGNEDIFDSSHEVIQILKSHFQWVDGIMFVVSEDEHTLLRPVFFDKTDEQQTLNLSIAKISDLTKDTSLPDYTVNWLNTLFDQCILEILKKGQTIQLINFDENRILKGDIQVLAFPSNLPYKNAREVILAGIGFNSALLFQKFYTMDIETIHLLINEHLKSLSCIGLKFPDGSVELTKY